MYAFCNLHIKPNENAFYDILIHFDLSLPSHRVLGSTKTPQSFNKSLFPDGFIRNIDLLLGFIPIEFLSSMKLTLALPTVCKWKTQRKTGYKVTLIPITKDQTSNFNLFHNLN